MSKQANIRNFSIIAHIDLVVAKSVSFRSRLRRKLHALPCSSSPQKA